MGNISENFMNLPKEKKIEIINNLVPSVCSSYCCRETCKGCFIQELTDEALNVKNN